MSPRKRAVFLWLDVLPCTPPSVDSVTPKSLFLSLPFVASLLAELSVRDQGRACSCSLCAQPLTPLSTCRGPERVRKEGVPPVMALLENRTASVLFTPLGFQKQDVRLLQPQNKNVLEIFEAFLSCLS